MREAKLPQLSESELIIVNRNGLKWVEVRNDKRYALPGIYSSELPVVLKHVSPRNGDVFVDVGAGAGKYTLPFSKLGMKVHAFEPNPFSRKLLAIALKLNNLLATTYPFGLSDSERITTISARGSQSRVDEGDIKIKIKPLDSFKFERIDIIKIDTEGHEANVLLGARETLSKLKPAVILEYHGKKRRRIVENILQSLGYKINDLGYHDLLLGAPD